MLTSCFDRVYVINLPDRSDRRAEIEAELNKLGMSLTSPGVTVFPAHRPLDAGEFPSIGARGCFMSHLGVLEDALANQARSILILEDDCDFAAQSAVSAVLNALQRLGTPGTGWSVFYGGYAGWEPPKAAVPSLEPLITVTPPTSLSTTHCVGFSQATILSLVPYLKAMLQRRQGDPAGGPMHVDGAYSWFRREHPEFKTRVAQPQIAHQRPSRSDVAGTLWHDRTPLGHWVTQRLRNVKRWLSRQRSA